MGHAYRGPGARCNSWPPAELDRRLPRDRGVLRARAVAAAHSCHWTCGAGTSADLESPASPRLSALETLRVIRDHGAGERLRTSSGPGGELARKGRTNSGLRRSRALLLRAISVPGDVSSSTFLVEGEARCPGRAPWSGLTLSCLLSHAGAAAERSIEPAMFREANDPCSLVLYPGGAMSSHRGAVTARLATTESGGCNTRVFAMAATLVLKPDRTYRRRTCRDRRRRA